MWGRKRRGKPHPQGVRMGIRDAAHEALQGGCLMGLGSQLLRLLHCQGRLHATPDVQSLSLTLTYRKTPKKPFSRLYPCMVSF